MGTRIVAHGAAVSMAARLIGRGLRRLASESVARAAQLAGSVPRSQAPTLRVSPSTR